MRTPRKQLSLDTNLPFDLAEEEVLVTSDKHLLDIDEDALLPAMNEADLPAVRPVHPRRLLRALH